MWTGDYLFLLRELVAKDFKVRYRNMSLGVFWSLLNPLVMMAVYTYVFTRILARPQSHFSVHLLCGLIPFNFFTIAWLSATNSLIENVAIIKRIPLKREIIPIASILSNITHLVIQLGLLLFFVLISGLSLNIYWFWLPVVWGLEIMFIMGLGLASSAMNLFVRDVRYVVESVNLLLFWMVPIVYTFENVPADFRDLYQYNPVAALILATQNIILGGSPPTMRLLGKLAAVSVVSLGAGLLIFRRAEKRFYGYL
ncbi:ABC transporter permease [uncultured Paludibaculum sp.]|uniref:ABC transporter permease n=1 Tax=uncultured Paludibaculum sp. TaxID=1765020 RepID=UPI002AABDE01|nr:ABC transporter permease [uncultured Paludibaculum sp.]